MNKLKVDRELFANKLKMAFNFIPTKQIIPAWENFRISVGDGEMQILASNGSIQIKLFCDCGSNGSFEFCVAAGLLLKTVSLLSENELTITQKSENKIELKSGKSKYNITLDCFPNDFTPMPMDSITSEITVNQFLLKMALKSTKAFVDEEHPNANMQAININEINNKIIFTGLTRGLMCRVAISPISITSMSSVCILTDTAKKILSLLGDKGEVGITHSGSKIKFFTDRESPDHFEVISVTSNTTFPGTEKLFAKKADINIIVNTIELKNAVKRLSLYTAIGNEPTVHISNAENSQELKLVSADNLTHKDGEEILSIINPAGTIINKKYSCEYLTQLLSEIDAAQTIVYFDPQDNTIPSFMIPKVNTEEENMYSFLIASLL